MQNEYTIHAIYICFACNPMAKKPIQVWIDETLKEQVERIFRRYGLDTASAVRTFFMKVNLTGGIPYNLRDDGYDHYTPEQMAEIERVYRESYDPKNVFGPFDSAEDMFTHIENEP